VSFVRNKCGITDVVSIIVNESQDILFMRCNIYSSLSLINREIVNDSKYVGLVQE